MLVPRLKALCFGFSLLVGSTALFTGCDNATADGLTGVWAGTANFEVDSILADQNMRIQADYQTSFTFSLTDDDGLISGSVVADFAGMRITQEAGNSADTLNYDGTVFDNELFGTYVDPELELDVPGGPYEENLWTFNVVGSRAELDEFLTHTHTIMLADSTEFTIQLNSDEFFEMELQD